nr:hypothetical protein [Pseudomonas corrugata]
MTMSPADTQRRMLLQIATGMAAAGTLGVTGASAAVSGLKGSGKPGDFDFLSGNWKIKHKQLKDGKWVEFEGEATVFGILGGLASVEELRIPSRNFSGMGLRILDVEKKLWADHWCNRKNGILNPASWGSFTDGAGIWDSNDVENGTPVIVRGVWDQITSRSCRWYQTVSRDNGASWKENWIMHWQKLDA